MTKRACRHLFVYGTLRAGSGHTIAGLLARRARSLGPGTAAGRLYLLGEYPALHPSPQNPRLVRGEVFELDRSDARATLARLDRYEGIGALPSAPNRYRRDLVDVTLADGSRLTVWAYLLGGDPDRLPEIPSGDYLEWLSAQRRGQPKA